MHYERVYTRMGGSRMDGALRYMDASAGRVQVAFALAYTVPALRCTKLCAALYHTKSRLQKLQ
jgi:hypothetical protein